MTNQPGPLAHRWPVRVYYEDTDAGGIVYHARYLQFCERARTEFLRAVGFDHRGLLAQHGILFTVRRLRLELVKPARLDDRLDVVSRVVAARGARLDFEQRIERGGDPIAVALVELAVVGPEVRPRRLPSALATLLSAWTQPAANTSNP